MTIFRPFLLVVGAIGLLAAAVMPLVHKKNSPGGALALESAVHPVVQVATSVSRATDRTIRLAGTLKSGAEANLSPKQGGRVVAVLVTEGQSVRRGQVVMRMDLSDMRLQGDQATAGLAAARANWQKAIDGEKLKRSDVERRIAEAGRGVEAARLQVVKAEAGVKLQSRASTAEISRAQAGVDAARSALAKAKRGARPQERRQAELAVRQAERGVGVAKKNLEDLEFLFSKGGVPRIEVDQAREGYQKAVDGVAQAKTQLELVEAGATVEDIEAAEAQVRSAEAALQAAKTGADRGEVDEADLKSARTQLARAEDGLRAAEASRSELELAKSDIRAARAAYDQAEAASRLAAQQILAAEITAPVDGVVTAVNVHVGELAGPGQSAVKIVGTSVVYLEAAAPSRVLTDLSSGQPARISVDAMPGKIYDGQVRSIGSVAARDGRSFPVRIDVSAPSGALKPGGFARATVVVERFAAAVTVPLQAVKADGQAVSVWVVRQGRIVEIDVIIPVQDERSAVVLGDVHAGEMVVTSNPPGVRPGDEVETRRWD